MQPPGQSTDWRLGHGRLEPALGDRKDACCFGRGEGLVEAENPAVAAIALGSLEGEGRAEAAVGGRVGRGRNDVLPDGNKSLRNGYQSGSQALAPV